MSRHRAQMQGHGIRYDNYYNPEGYADPTAGCAINGNCEIYAAPLRRLPGEKEKVVRLTIPPVSELEDFLAEMGYTISEGKGGLYVRKYGKCGRQSGKRKAAAHNTDHTEAESAG